MDANLVKLYPVNDKSIFSYTLYILIQARAKSIPTARKDSLKSVRLRSLVVQNCKLGKYCLAKFEYDCYNTLKKYPTFEGELAKFSLYDANCVKVKFGVPLGAFCMRKFTMQVSYWNC